jgi:integrase
LGFDGNGRRKRRVVYGESKGEVQEKLRRLQHDVDRGVDVLAEQLTVGQWLTRWLALVKPNVERGTYGPYRRHCEQYLSPILGRLGLAKLRRVHVQEMYAALAGKGVSAAMQRKIGTTLAVALNEAVRLDLIPSNPTARVKKPKAAKPEVKPLDGDQVRRFLDAAMSDRFYAYYVAAVDSGARPGELLALGWGDIDFDRGGLSISKSLEEVEGRLAVKGTKSRKGCRRVELSPRTMLVLAEHRKAALAAGFQGGPVFCNCRGGHVRRSPLYRDSLSKVAARAGLQGVTLYTLRHTAASLLLSAGVNVKVISERLGHASVTLTLDTYAHLLPGMQTQAAAAMQKILECG